MAEAEKQQLSSANINDDNDDNKDTTVLLCAHAVLSCTYWLTEAMSLAKARFLWQIV